MVNDGRDMCIQRKRSRDDMDIYEEEAMRFFPMLVGFFVMLVGICSHRKYLVKEPSRSEIEEKIFRRRFWMGSLTHETTCKEQLCINIHGLNKLCHILSDEGGLVATKNVTIREIVVLFLIILAHNLKNRTIKAMYAHSGKTISRQFHTVLQAVIKIGKIFFFFF
jgi:hypothetical protein